MFTDPCRLLTVARLAPPDRCQGIDDTIRAWADMLRMVPRFPLFGSGFNAFGTGYLPYQTIDKNDSTRPAWRGIVVATRNGAL